MGALSAGCDIRQSPETWPADRELLRRIVTSIATVPVVLLCVATPDELDYLPVSSWVVLDCADEERQRRLRAAGRDHDIDDAITDARQYRGLGLPVIDTTGRPPARVAADVAGFVRKNSPWDDQGPAG